MPQTIPAGPDAPGPTPVRRRTLAIILAVAALALVASSAELHGWLMGMLPAVEAIVKNRPILGVTVFVLFTAAAAMLAFVTSAVIVPVGIYVWGDPATMVLLWVGWMLGGSVAYSLSRYFGRPVVKALGADAALSRYEDRISRAAPFGFILLFQLALPSEVPGYLLGLIQYPVLKYLGALALAELPYAVATVHLGSSFMARRTSKLVAVGAAVAALSGWALYTLQRRLSHKRR